MQVDKINEDTTDMWNEYDELPQDDDSSYSADDFFDRDDEDDDDDEYNDEEDVKVVDDDDDDDDEYDDEKTVKPIKKQHSNLDFIENSYKINNDEEDDGKHLFASRRKASAKLGTNDAIKIISTPHGKVGILYQSTNSNDTKKSTATSGTDMKQRITPVLTPDGKVALLYRGASDVSNKYEPIQDLTNFTDNKPFSSIKNLTIIETNSSVLSSTQSTTTVTIETTTVTTTTTKISQVQLQDNNEEENSILPNINRPLSEVLGIKKNQFTQFRITDKAQTATPPLSPFPQTTPSNQIPEVSNYEYDYGDEDSDSDTAESTQRSQIQTPPYQDIDDTIKTTTFADVLTKTEVVNLAIIPAFDSDLQLIQEQENRHTNHHRKHHRHRQQQQHRHDMQDLSAIHCAMQAMVAIAAMATVFGMLGAYFKTRVLDQITIMHW